MSNIKRFSVSIQEKLLKGFDSLVKRKRYPTRSKAVEDLIRQAIRNDVLDKGGTATGAIVMVYDHHRRELVSKLTDIQHDFHGMVICNQHIHLDHHNCMEVVVVKGRLNRIHKFTDKLRSQKGVKSASLNIAAAD